MMLLFNDQTKVVQRRCLELKWPSGGTSIASCINISISLLIIYLFVFPIFSRILILNNHSVPQY